MRTRSRRSQSKQIRYNAAELAAQRPHEQHINNAEEYAYRNVDGTPSHLASFTKGLPHHPITGLVMNPVDYQLFIDGIQQGDAATLSRIPLGPAEVVSEGCPSRPIIRCDNNESRSAVWCSTLAKEAEFNQKKGVSEGAKVRAWESQAAGNLYDLEGPDAQAYTMPPAPRLGSDELAFEMAEIYEQALLRDQHVSVFSPGNSTPALDASLSRLNQVLGFEDAQGNPTNPTSTEDFFQRRKLTRLTNTTVFRGITPGDDVGPYLSQFLLVGNRGINQRDKTRSISTGRISYGAMRINQKVRVANECKDYMTTFEQWLDVQNGADLRDYEDYWAPNDPRLKIGKGHRFITHPRDLATYVHYDQLYQAYFNACLILFGLGAPLDPGLPFEASDLYDHQQGFASFGGPHLLALLTEVSSRALKAVRYQKFNVHRRARPEVIAARVDRLINLQGIPGQAALLPAQSLRAKLDSAGVLGAVQTHNNLQNTQTGAASYLLPMAFPEGSPMHPSYGAGHATVAGACVTILKAFFDHGWQLQDGQQPFAYVPDGTGQFLTSVTLDPGEVLTVEGELNKLASNISIGRNWAGVHYYSDYIESIRLGEKIALGILEEQKLCYKENFSMTVPLYDGGAIQI